MSPPSPPRRSATTAATAATPAADGDFAETLSRAPSLWPDSSQLPAGHRGDGSTFSTTRFDPLAEERGRLQAQAAAAFDVCHPGLALRAVLLVQAVLAIAALAGADTLPHWASRQGMAAFAGVAGTLLWLVGVCAARGLLQRLDSAPRALAVLAAGAVAAWLAVLPLDWAGLLPTSAAGLPQGAGWLRAAGALAAGAAFAGLLWAWLDLRSRIWHPANASARLAELQSRIRPHFLFNALNTALALVRVDPARAEAVLEDLAQIFRTALADVGASVPLSEEIELARRYLDIEQIRFGQRLRVQWQLSDDKRVAAARVPPLVLQPLVENAVRHGVEPAADGGDLRISTTVQRGQVVIVVTNTVGDDSGAPGHGMALHNVRERLRLLHDVAAQCDVWREPALHGAPASGAAAAGDLFHARIVLPLD
jgi:two-component system sensor histidine kinase AlgZ